MDEASYLLQKTVVEQSFQAASCYEAAGRGVRTTSSSDACGSLLEVWFLDGEMQAGSEERTYNGHDNNNREEDAVLQRTDAEGGMPQREHKEPF